MDGLDAKIVDQEVQGALKFQLSPQDLDLSADHIHHLTGIGKLECRSSIVAPRRTASIRFIKQFFYV